MLFIYLFTNYNDGEKYSVSANEHPMCTHTHAHTHTQYMNMKYNSNVPLVLMNSFNTHADTERVKFKYERRIDNLHMFQQSYYPRVLKETLRPYPEKFDLQDGW